MGADGADLGRLRADHDVPAVAALPDLDLALGEDRLRLHVFQQRAVALLVVLLDGGHTAELRGQLREALGLGGDGEALVHVGPLVVLAVSGGGEVFGGAADPVQLLEPELGVLLLVLGGLEEERRDLLEALLLGLGGEIGVFVPGLGLAREGGLQVLLGLGSGVGIVGHVVILLFR